MKKTKVVWEENKKRKVTFKAPSIRIGLSGIHGSIRPSKNDINFA